MTEEGGALLMTRIAPYWINGLEIKNFKGHLAHEFELKEVKYYSHGFNYQAKRLNITWSPTNLLDIFRKEIVINHLKVDEFSIRIPEGMSDDLSSAVDLTLIDFEMLDLVNFDFDKLHFPKVPKNEHRLPFKIDKLNLNHGKVKVGRLEILLNKLDSLNFSTYLWRFNELMIDSNLGKMNATLNQNIYSVNWDVNIDDLNLLFPNLKGDLKTIGHTTFDSKNLQKTQTELSLTSHRIKYRHHHLHDLSLLLSPKLNSHLIQVEGQLNQYDLKGHIETLFLPKKVIAKLRNFKEIEGEIVFEFDKELLAQAQFELLGKNSITAQCYIASNASYPIRGTIDAYFDDYALLSTFLTDLKAVRGRWNSHIDISGHLFSPQFNGSINANNINFTLPKSNMDATISSLKLVNIGEKIIDITGKGYIGTGLFTINGQGVLDEPNPYFTLEFKGKNLTLNDSPEYTIIADPDLNLAFKTNRLELKGEIFVPSAIIKPKMRPYNSSRSTDVKVITHTPSAQRALIDEYLSAQVKLKLGDDVYYEGFNVKTHVKGDLIMSKAPHVEMRALGSLYAKEGKYRAHNRSLDIPYGRLMFTDAPITQPLLDFRAQKEINSLSQPHQRYQNLTVGLHLKGPLHALKLTPFSQPALPESDILSYLALGYPSGRNPTIPGNILLDSATQLTNLLNHGTIGENDLASKLNMDIGFEVSSKDKANHSRNDDTALTIGKQLSDRLYMNYSVGILDTSSQVGLKFLLSKHAAIEAHTGEKGSGADLFVTLEGK